AAPLPPEERQAQTDGLFRKFEALMERGNFKKLSREEIEKAITDVPTEWGLATDVDLNIFERLEVYARGDRTGERTRRLWWKLWRLEKIRLPVYSRVVMILKLRKHRRVEKGINTDAVFLKIFKDVPKADLEMLLPGARVRLSKMDRGLIVYPLLSG